MAHWYSPDAALAAHHRADRLSCRWQS